MSGVMERRKECYAEETLGIVGDLKSHRQDPSRDYGKRM
jgi:hypothetical protein